MSGTTGAGASMDALLRRYWPPEGQILLLTAALCDVAIARDAWRQWNAKQDLADATASEIRLLAAVARRIGALMPDAALDTRLEGTRRYIWTLTQMTLGTTRPLLAALRAADLRLMLIKGAARLAADPILAQERALRDIDVLVHPDDWPRALEIAAAEGWRRNDGGDISTKSIGHAIGLRDPRSAVSGECDLHRFALVQTRNRGQDSGLWQRAQPVSFLGIDVFCASRTDQAMVTLAHAMRYGVSPQPAHWALDVDPMIRAGKIDWERFLAEVHLRRIELFMAAPLLLLRERMQCPVPDDVMRALTRPIGKAYLVEYETLATNYGPTEPEAWDALRTAAIARAHRAMRAFGIPPAASRAEAAAVTRIAHLGRKQSLEIPVPLLDEAKPCEGLHLEIKFRVWHAGKQSQLRLDTAGVPLKSVPIGRANRKAGGRIRRRIVLRCPAGLFSMLGSETVRLRTGNRLTIKDVTIRWGAPPTAGRLANLAARLRSWWRAS